MYKVFLKIDRVGLRIKQNIEIQAAIKKSEQNFFIPKTTYLRNSIAELNTSTQFYIDPTNPVFEIYILLIYENNKKLVGMLTLNLNKFQPNINNPIHTHLQQSPDLQSYIVLQFTYTTRQQPPKNSELIQYSNMQQIIQQMQERNQTLQIKNNKLKQELKELQQANMSLENGKNTMDDEYEKSQESFQSQNEGKKLKFMNQEQYINEMEEKMGKLKELVNNFGGQDIRDQVHNIFRFQ